MKSFVDNPTNQYELLKDRNIEAEMGSDRFKRMFLMLFIERYTEYVNNGCVETLPESVKYGKEEWIGNSEEIKYVSQFQADFEITNDEADFVESACIENWLKSKDLGISMKKFTAELKKHCSLKGLDNVYNKVKKIKGKSPMVWVGMKLSTEFF